jgi:uncharacterized protein
LIAEDPLQLLLLAALVLGAAVLYSSVGHAGASGYLAAMALMGVAAPVTKPAALVMNIAVAAVGTWRFSAARLVPWKLLRPLVIGSVPGAFAGGLIALPTNVHRIVLGIVLLFAAIRLAWPTAPSSAAPRAPGPAVLVPLGAAIGVLAGLTGVGGGIFLSPLLILAGWEETRRTAGASAVFILVNSISGLAGHLGAGRAIPSEVALLAPVALAGGLYGSWLGARRLAPPTLRRVLAAVLLVAGLKLIFSR